MDYSLFHKIKLNVNCVKKNIVENVCKLLIRVVVMAKWLDFYKESMVLGNVPIVRWLFRRIKGVIILLVIVAINFATSVVKQ